MAGYLIGTNNPDVASLATEIGKIVGSSGPEIGQTLSAGELETIAANNAALKAALLQAEQDAAKKDQ